ncbi:phosphatidate cytidylyltransferase [Schleiferiaceae bacterium]|jgi:phosphatidate cytidylyltransferase|nr:phosphatidate cytidylyltransferase [Schleiferiaceae bacterium]
MMQRSLWGAVYALAIFWICNGRPWSPYILSLPLLGVAWEFIQMSKLSVQQRGLGLAYTFLAGWSTYQIIDTWEDTSGFILFSAFLLIWLSDSMAYVGGRLVGRTPLAPLLSPKKTWEGAISGAVFTLLIGSAYLVQMDGPISSYLEPSTWPRYAWLFPLVVVFTAPVGDLLGSKFKRLADVKDSGVFLPGHGGFLDRFDSFLLTIIVLALFQSYILIA